MVLDFFIQYRITLSKAIEIGSSFFLRHLRIQIDKLCSTNLNGAVTDVCRGCLVRHGIRDGSRNGSTRIEVDCTSLTIRNLRILSHQIGSLKHCLCFAIIDNSSNSSLLGIIGCNVLISIVNILRDEVALFILTLAEQTIVMINQVIGRTIVIVRIILAGLVLFS